MHYTEVRRARVAIGLELQSRGWTLYGFSEDRSDSMTDYYSPASWQGIAERDGYVVVVDAGGSTLRRSGGYDTEISVPGEPCPRCAGSGEEPDRRWTLESAQADPVTFNHDRIQRQGSGGLPLLPHVVSPLYFHASGYEKCIRCHGAGHLAATQTMRVEWPTFQANAPGKKWHVEHAGRVLDSGVGLGPCADYDRARAATAVNRIVDRVEAATRRREGNDAPAADTTSTGEVTVRRNLEHAGIEIVFPAKPDETVRAGLKRLGFRWSGRQGLWYARYSAGLWDRAHEFLKLDDAGVWQRPEPVLLTPELAGLNVAGPGDILSATDVYGRRARISRRDYDLGRTQIRLYCQTADILLTDLPPSHPARQAQGGATTIHRDNVATVDRAGTPRSIDVAGVTWYAGENDAPQTFWWHRDDQGRLWQAILSSGATAWWGSVDTKQGICNLTTACDHGAHREEDPLCGQADAAGVDPPIRLLTAMSELIRSGVDPHTLPKVTTSNEPESLESKDPAAMTSAEILVEALRIDTLIRASDHGFPAAVAERMEALRAAMFRLDPGVDLDAALRQLRAHDVPKLVRQWQDINRRLNRGHGMSSHGRASATTKHAHLGKLAQSRDQVLETLRLVVRQAEERGEPIHPAIRSDPELARILVSEPEPEAAEAIDAEPEQPLLDHAVTCLVAPWQADNLDTPTIRGGANRLDELLVRVSEQPTIVHVDQILSPRLNDEQQRHAADERERSRQTPSVIMTLRRAAHGTTGQRLANRGWWWNGDLQAWQHHDPDEGWLTLWYLEIDDQVSGVYDAVPVMPDASCNQPAADRLDVDGVTWRLAPTPDGRPVWTAEGKKRRLWSVTRFHGSGALAGRSWWTVQTEVDDRLVPLNTRIDGTGEGPLYALTDDQEPSPPTSLLRATTELIRLDYPNPVTLDGIAWQCELHPSGEIRYEARRDPWWCFYVEGRPGGWKACWHKPGDIGTLRCLSEEEHSELEGEQNPLAMLEMLTGYIRARGGPPPRIEISCAEIVPGEAGGWDCYPTISGEATPPIDNVPVESFQSEPLAPALMPIQAHSGTTAYQYSLF